MNHLPFPAHYLHYRVIQPISLVKFLEYSEVLPPVTSVKIQKYIQHLESTNWQPHDIEQTIALNISCDLIVSQPSDTPVSVALEYQDETGHWVQLIAENKRLSQQKVHFSGEVILHPNHTIEFARLICAGVSEETEVKAEHITIKPHRIAA